MPKYRRPISTLILLCLLTTVSSCMWLGPNPDQERINRILRTGNEALLAKRYDEAIKQFDVGLAISPAEPAFLINKATALRARAVDRFNSSLQLKDAGAKASGIAAAYQDFRDSAVTATEAANSMKANSSPLDLLEGSSRKDKELLILSSRAESMRLLASKVDKTQAKAALGAIDEYIEMETDQGKKTRAQLGAGRMLLDTDQPALAYDEYKKILATEPNNTEAALGVGLALFQSGDKARYQEAAVYLQRFVDQAPDSHPLKASAKDALDFMKQQENNPRSR